VADDGTVIISFEDTFSASEDYFVKTTTQIRSLALHDSGKLFHRSKSLKVMIAEWPIHLLLQRA